MAFTWTPFYKELSDWLLEKQDSQSDLISILKKLVLPVLKMHRKRQKDRAEQAT